MILALVLALSTSQVTGQCSAGRNCRSASFTASTSVTNTTALWCQQNPFFAWGMSQASQQWRLSNASTCATAVTGNVVTVDPSSGTWIFGNNYALTFAGHIAPTNLPALSGVRGLASDATTNRVWRGDTVVWRDVQSGAHPVLDGATYWYTGDLGTTGGLTWRTTPRLNGADVAFTTVSASSATLNGAVDFQTTAVSGNQAHHSSAAFVRRQGRPRWSFTGFPFLGSSNIRIFIGLSSALPVAAGSSTPTTTGLLFRQDTTVGANIFACSAAAAALTCVDTGVAAQSFNERRLEIDCREAAACTFWVDGQARVRTTTNLPALATLMGSTVSVETLTTAAQSTQVRRVALETLE